MATIVLTAVGTALGGPIGGAVGAAVGSYIDQTILFPPKGRQGARLGELSVQTSAYGAPIPKLFGSMRVAGTVIWATELREDMQRSGSAKSGGKTTSYSYSASFAVALSGRAIRAVHRIWADGKLLRGAAGDWKSDTGFRLYLGDEDQEADPLIAADEGIGNCPAYRGIAYAVFEHMQLADYGNRLPSLSFEVEADAGPVTVGDIAGILCGGAVTGETGAALPGYAAGGDSVRGAIETLGRAMPLSIRDDGSALVLSDALASPVMVRGDELGASPGSGKAERRQTDRQASSTLPDQIAISYYEPLRDYQPGLQRASRGGPGRRGEKIELAAALPADQAKELAEESLARAWRERMRAKVLLPWRRMDLRPGMRVTLPDQPGTWRITRMTLEAMAIELELVKSAQAAGGSGSAAPGRSNGAEDSIMGATVLALMDLPPLGENPETQPRLWIAAAGTEPGWRRAEVSMSLDGGTSWTPLGRTAAPAVMGSVSAPLMPGDAALLDLNQTIIVELLHQGMTLQGCDDAALMAGGNAAMLGGELIQFGSAIQTGTKTFLLSRLLRGRRGTEAAIGAHGTDERFVLIEAAALLPMEVAPAAIGTTASLIGVGPGDGNDPATATSMIDGNTIRPPPPVHLAARRLNDGTIRFSWTRRSRIGWGWRNGGDAPLGEESERYRLALAPTEGSWRIVETMGPQFDYLPAAQADDGSAGAATIMMSVIQAGSLISSEPATADFIMADI